MDSFPPIRLFPFRSYYRELRIAARQLIFFVVELDLEYSNENESTYLIGGPELFNCAALEQGFH